MIKLKNLNTLLFLTFSIALFSCQNKNTVVEYSTNLDYADSIITIKTENINLTFTSAVNEFYKVVPSKSTDRYTYLLHSFETSVSPSVWVINNITGKIFKNVLYLDSTFLIQGGYTPQGWSHADVTSKEPLKIEAIFQGAGMVQINTRSFETNFKPLKGITSNVAVKDLLKDPLKHINSYFGPETEEGLTSFTEDHIGMWVERYDKLFFDKVANDTLWVGFEDAEVYRRRGTYNSEIIIPAGLKLEDLTLAEQPSTWLNQKIETIPSFLDTCRPARTRSIPIPLTEIVSGNSNSIDAELYLSKGTSLFSDIAKIDAGERKAQRAKEYKEKRKREQAESERAARATIYIDGRYTYEDHNSTYRLTVSNGRWSLSTAIKVSGIASSDYSSGVEVNGTLYMGAAAVGSANGSCAQVGSSPRMCK